MAEIDPESIAGVAARLALWGSRAPKGLARVEFDSDFSRQNVDALVRDACAEANLPFYPIELPLHRPAHEIVVYLLDTLAPLPHGVVSITGWATAFPTDVDLLASLYILNLNRENLAQFPLCQIWWMTRPFTDIVIREIPDLASWFIIRLSLHENIALRDDEVPSSVVTTVSQEKQDSARKQSADLVARFNVAMERGEDASVLLMLAGPAVVTLHNADLAEETHELADTVLQRLIAYMSSQEHYASYHHDSFNHAEIWKEILSSQNIDASHRMSDLAFLFDASGRTQEAGEFYKAAVEITLSKVGPYAPFDDASLHQLATFYCNQKNYEEAIQLYRRILADAETLSYISEIHQIDFFSVLAHIYVQTGDYAEAEDLLRHALRIEMKFTDVYPTITVKTLEDFAALYRRLGRYAEAEQIIARFPAWREYMAKKYGIGEGEP